MTLSARSFLLALLLATSGCSLHQATSPSPSSPTVMDRLWFGKAIPSGGEVTDQQWREFIDEVVTPRFPDGLTLYRAQGQWRDPRGNLVREQVLVLEVVHRAGAAADSAIQAIADEYKRRFRQDAVLHVRGLVDIKLLE